MDTDRCRIWRAGTTCSAGSPVVLRRRPALRWAIAELVPPQAVRLRRDFGAVLTLVRAHALLHRASRELDAAGCIVASLDDYGAVRELVEDLIASGVGATVPATIRETVQAVADLLDGKGSDETVSITKIAKALALDKAPTSRRVRAAIDGGYLVNHEDKKGRPAKIAIGEGLPEDAPILPECCAVALLMEGDQHPPPPPDDEDPFVATSYGTEVEDDLEYDPWSD